MRNTALSLLVVLIFVVDIAAQGNKPSRPTPSPTPPPVTVTFNYCVAGDFSCETANRVRNDLNRAYVDGSEGMAITFQTLSGSNDLTINFTNSTRTVTYDLTEMSASGNPTPAWVSQPAALKPAFNVFGAYNAKLQCGSAPTCDINYVTGMNGGGFTIDRIDYRLQWHPTSIQPYINTPEISSAVNVHYVKDANSEVFTVTPLPNSDSGRTIAGLQGETKRSVTPGGQYVMPFTLTVRLH
jgi:hypothetical protein